MTYQVLARKWRPREFASLTGQEHVVRALTNALEQQRLHHAYLFTGTRGVGKTTLARIFAKCLNCETGVTSRPCGQCSSCTEIDAGRFVDLLEIDAASRTKVEDTRDLLENVQYAPSKGRYKVYIIDEVHMLSGHSFNALLKTLEEPPPHVKFLLATTDPQKLPVTVLSRCLQFHLKNLMPEQITQHLEQVLIAEKIAAENEALLLLARAANGSMRDALSLLDQAIGYGNGTVTSIDVKSMLGTIEQTYLVDLLTALANQDAAALFTTIQQFAEQATDFADALEELLTLLHQIALAQALPTIADETARNLAQRFSAEEIQLYYQIGLIGRRDLALAPSSKIGFEMVLLRMLSFRPDTNAATIPSAATAKTIATPKAAVAVTTHVAAPPTTTNDWNSLLTKLNLMGPTRAFAMHCALIHLNDNEIQLAVDTAQASLLNDKMKERLKIALEHYFQKPMQLSITVNKPETAVLSPAAQTMQLQQTRQANANQTIAADQKVQAILSTFNATIVPDSTKAID